MLLIDQPQHCFTSSWHLQSQEYKYADVKASRVMRGAHSHGEDISCVRWHRDGVQLASRSTDGTLKLWDVRKFVEPLAEWSGLEALMPMVRRKRGPAQLLTRGR